MHLSELHPRIKDGRRIYRKDDLGQAGQIYGDINRKIHFEIVCDDANLRKLVGRVSDDVNIAQNGRTDAVYGEIYFTLPVGTQIFSELPLPQLVRAHVQPPKPHKTAPLPPIVPLAVKHTTTEALVIGMRHATGAGVPEKRGDTYFSTYKLDGSIVGNELREAGGEYQIYSTATNISKAFPAASQPAPSAVYELLRFGRVVNTTHETLTPNDVPHWRQVSFPGGTGWVNLNVAGVAKFSDSDFPQWRGWKIIDDSQDSDSHCDSTIIKNWLDISGNGKVDPIEAAVALNDSAVITKLEKTICKFPSEWQSSTIDKRWNWLKIQSEENPVPLTDENFTELKAHITALCFSLPSLDTALWHWNPLQFIKHFRTCGWLSLREMAQLIPRQMGRSPSRNDVSWDRVLDRLNHNNNHITAIAINQTFRKYGFTTANRQTAFFAQVYIETGLLSTATEGGSGAFNARLPMTRYYAAFFGRGLMQLTWASAYESYGKYRKFPNHVGQYVDPRITATSTHYWAAPTTDEHGHLHSDQRLWSPRYDPAIVASDDYNVCDSACFYWVTKSFLGQKNIHRIADEGITTETIGKMSILVNGGGNGYNERQQYGNFVYRYRSDVVDISVDGNVSAVRQLIHTVNHHTVWGTSGLPYNVYVNYTAQRE